MNLWRENLDIRIVAFDCLGKTERSDGKDYENINKRLGFLFVVHSYSEMSIISPTTSGFTKVAAFSLVNTNSDSGFQLKNRNEDITRQFAEFNEHFIGHNENFNIKYRTFQDYLPKIVGSFKSLQKRRSGDKVTVLNVFSKEEWYKLASEKKADHKLFDCGGCMNNPKLKGTQGRFFVTEKFKKLAEEKGLTGKPVAKFNRESATAFVEERVPPSILNKYDESIAVKSIRNINDAKKKTAVVRSFGGDVSLSCLNRHRMVEGFESKKAAEDRTMKNVADLREGLKRPHSHVGDLGNFSSKWNSEACLVYVNGLCEGSFLNFSHLAREFGLKEMDCKQKVSKGQIVIEFLIASGVNIDKFDYHAKLPENGVNIRRKKLDNNKSVSVPMDPTTGNITKYLISDIQEGKYSFGESMVPIKFKKISVSKDGNLTEDYFYVRGRKNPLSVIRQNLYNSHKTYYRIQSDPEIDEMTAEDIIQYLCLINEYKDEGDDVDIMSLKNKLKYFQ